MTDHWACGTVPVELAEGPSILRRKTIPRILWVARLPYTVGWLLSLSRHIGLQQLLREHSTVLRGRIR